MYTNLIRGNCLLHNICLVGLIVLLMGCQHFGVNLEEKVETTAQDFGHLEKYRELNCQVKFSYAQPIQSAWVPRLKVEGVTSDERLVRQMFTQLEKAEFAWRSTPYRCSLQPRGDWSEGKKTLERVGDVVYKDAQQKLNLVVCTWLQSFYTDSPFRGWRQGEPKLEKVEKSLRLVKGESRWVDISENRRIITAQLGPGVELTGQYEPVGEKLYPSSIRLNVNGKVSTADSFVYEHQSGFELIKSFWLRLPDPSGQQSAYLRADITSCTREQ